MIFVCLDRNVPKNKLAREIAFLGDTLDLWVGRRENRGTAIVAAPDQGPNISWGQTLPMSPGGIRHGLHPSTSVLALLLGQEWGWLVQNQILELKKPCWPAGVAKSSEHQIYQRMWKTIQTSSSYCTHLNNFTACRSHSIALKKCSSSCCFLQSGLLSPASFLDPYHNCS